MRGERRRALQPPSGTSRGANAVRAGACTDATMKRTLAKVSTSRRSVPQYIRGAGSTTAMMYRGLPFYEMDPSAGLASSDDLRARGTSGALSYAEEFDGAVPTPSYVQPLSGVRGTTSHGPPWLPVPATRSSLAKSTSLSTLGGAGWEPTPRATWRDMPPIDFRFEPHGENKECVEDGGSQSSFGAKRRAESKRTAAVAAAATAPVEAPRSSASARRAAQPTAEFSATVEGAARARGSATAALAARSSPRGSKTVSLSPSPRPRSGEGGSARSRASPRPSSGRSRGGKDMLTKSTRRKPTRKASRTPVTWNLRSSVVAPKGSVEAARQQESVMQLAQADLSAKLERCRYLIQWAFGAFEEQAREEERRAASQRAYEARKAAAAARKAADAASGQPAFAKGLRSVMANTFAGKRAAKAETRTRHRIDVMKLVGVLQATAQFQGVELEHIKRRVLANVQRILEIDDERAAAAAAGSIAPNSVDARELEEAFGIARERSVGASAADAANDGEDELTLSAAEAECEGAIIGVRRYAIFEEARVALSRAMEEGSKDEDAEQHDIEMHRGAQRSKDFRLSLRYNGEAADEALGSSSVAFDRVATAMYESHIAAASWTAVALHTHLAAEQRVAATRAQGCCRMFLGRVEMKRILRVRTAMARFKQRGVDGMRACFEGWMVVSQRTVLARFRGCRKLREWRNVVAALHKKRALFRQCFWPLYVWRRETRVAVVGAAKAEVLLSVWTTCRQMMFLRAWRAHVRVRVVINREVHRMELRRLACDMQVWKEKVASRRRLKMMVSTKLNHSLEERALPLLVLRYWAWGCTKARTMGYGADMRDCVRRWLEARVQYQSELMALDVRLHAEPQARAAAREYITPPDPLAQIPLLAAPAALEKQLTLGGKTKNFVVALSEQCAPMREHFRSMIWVEMRVNYARLWRVGKKVFTLWNEAVTFAHMTDAALLSTLGGRRFVLSGMFARWSADVKRTRKFRVWRDGYKSVDQRRETSRRDRAALFLKRWDAFGKDRNATLRVCDARLAELTKKRAARAATAAARNAHLHRQRERYAMTHEDSVVFFERRAVTQRAIKSTILDAGINTGGNRAKILLDICYNIHEDVRRKITQDMVRTCLRGLRVQLLEARGRKLLVRAQIRNSLRIAARFRRLYRGMPTYRRLRVQWGCFNKWLRYLGARTTLMPPGLLIVSERRRNLLLRFSMVLETETSESPHLMPLKDPGALVGKLDEVLQLNAGMLVGHLTSLSVDLPRIGASVSCCLTRWMEYTQVSLVEFSILPALVIRWRNARLKQRVFEGMRSGLKVRYALQIRGRSTYLEASLRQAIDHWLLMLHAGYNSSFVQRVRQWRNFARGKLKRLSRQESLKRLLVQHRTQVLERLKIEQSYLFEHYRDRKKVEVIEWSRMCTGPQWSGASTGAFAGTTPALAPFEWDESAKGAFFGPVPDLAAAEESSSHAAASGGAAFAVGGDGWSLAELAVYCDRDGVCGIALRVRLADTLVVHGIRTTNGESTSAYSFRFEPGEVVVCAEGLALPDGRVLKLRIWTSAGRCSSWMKPPTLASDASMPSSRREKSAVHFSLPGPRPKKSEAATGGAKKRASLSLSRSPRRHGGKEGDDAQHPAVIVGFCGLVKPTEEEVDAGRLMSLGVVLRQARPVSLFAGFEQETTDLQMSAEQLKVQSETTFQIVLQMRANDIVTSMERAHKLADSLRRKSGNMTTEKVAVSGMRCAIYFQLCLWLFEGLSHGLVRIPNAHLAATSKETQAEGDSLLIEAHDVLERAAVATEACHADTTLPMWQALDPTICGHAVVAKRQAKFAEAERLRTKGIALRKRGRLLSSKGKAMIPSLPMHASFKRYFKGLYVSATTFETLNSVQKKQLIDEG